jgi:hypothetical protein
MLFLRARSSPVEAQHASVLDRERSGVPAQRIVDRVAMVTTAARVTRPEVVTVGDA